MAVDAPQEQRALALDGVEVMSIRLEARRIHRVHHDPGGGLVGGDAGADGVGGFGDLELLVVQRAAAERERPFGGVDVGVDEAGQHGVAAGVDHAGARAYPLSDALLVADVDDLVAAHGESGGGGRGAVLGAHVGIAHYEIGRGMFLTSCRKR